MCDSESLKSNTKVVAQLSNV